MQNAVPNPSTLQARVIVDELVRGGVTDIVLCPGSRNAPLAFAVHAADVRGDLRLHVRIDERTAGFLAVGIAAATRRPVAVIMTSGTAVANLSPAVYEANYARVPLLVISANRPYELLGSGANQTVEQFGIFGTQVRACLSLGLAEPGLDRNSQWRSAVCRALAAARGARTGNAGPVQFDIPLREPLVPDDPSPALAQGRPDGGPWTVAPVATLDVPLPIDLSPDTVVISGHGAGANPALAHLPTVAEPTAPQPKNPLHPWALPLLRPRQAIICGRPTLHREVSALLADPGVTVYAVTTGPRWPDVSGNVAATGTRVVPVGDPDEAWLARCAEADRLARAAVTDGLAAEPVTGLHVARAVCAALRPGDQLVVGASNPVRDVALAGDVPPGVTVLSNRGVAGIDGTVSTAVGAALAAPDTRTIALMGDLTFVHDASGLLIGPEEPRPRDLTIVVANDNGGGIFNLLEQGEERYSGAEYDGAAARVFGTPHGTDLASLCAAYGIDYRLAEVDDLAAIAAEPGMRVVEVRTQRSGLRALHAGMRARIAGDGR
ncbi:2-succinyl-5-enolpyruvyl-6-hydroxy-3-cyclohexene-1-carboxylate synthase OS=Tsukamurella paurometabola(strain ATCC 8368 / DSM / CCUG 35730 / CIP 100753/ JCM 10117 / KCTC 9821 / NBRC 16120 / NCIMB 702349 / NCTC 13040)OX=521096 GN=menD PE=3 SV=1 [Tsukamurella paurometabola]|uniref:2-succinyl-5-enolpyruvyl-6-hydroxy-3-cyclohexene-1-carboxylate synthase n=1 Tax=Tsukamurella paurometabola (strain ATCC 8368 / DSM 20162 / CCUG 35730 / CIP 100753 / JCM 10117 / KCTC 9821 / NBRC 16120 / NCIMB 702349 / NCTC 13040) TaxID=521096 RepID=D5UTL2_TSUPD|nr:2-succinyl-5-enolpyruvyl-6-hydroxy-3-cyclohexene-1-carboxylic-acid synthase [Tsukamurella paurometabola]ADG77366.1 thiamine pyrophosphate protein TPP binding domain protein [Tsukamurella paurometabola DSM 20162]SUP26704.1 2-succinyl-5-enolpyruvyl-6-hydroxy-3-cyclohexene-1-carboxylate synthase [Tsukamurella paurometabola]